MRIIFLKQPKKTLLNVLHIFSLLMLVTSLIAIATIFIWREYPQLVSVVDKSIPDFYGKNIEGLYKKAKESPSDIERYKNFSQLYEELYDVTSVNKYYKYRREAGQFLTDYYASENQLQKALELTERWKDDYPYDFLAKFQYSKVLAQIDKNEAKLYLEKLYTKHTDIPEVHSALQSFLIKNGYINEAILMGDAVSLRKNNARSFFMARAVKLCRWPMMTASRNTRLKNRSKAWCQYGAALAGNRFFLD